MEWGYPKNFILTIGFEPVISVFMEKLYKRTHPKLGTHSCSLLCCKVCWKFKKIFFENGKKSHICTLCVAPSEGDSRTGVVHPSEWSYFSILICAVAAAWKLENSCLLLVVRPVPTLGGLAGTVVERKCK